jgi:acyl-CoA synthetase (AMP-forming)/AMP-acid ligase II
MGGLSGMIREVLAIDPPAPALEFEQHWLSWADLSGQARLIMDALEGLDLPPGARVAVLLRNRPSMVAALLALLLSERCLATLNAASPDDKLAQDLGQVGAPVILGLSEDWARPGLLDAAARAFATCIAIDGVLRVLHAGEPARAVAPTARGIAIEMLSSGTTGAPKRIPLPARNFEKALLSAASYEKGRDEGSPMRLRGGVSLVTAPLAHIAGITGVMNNLLAGRKICLLEKFSVEGFRDAVARHRPKVAGAPPSALRMILDANVPAEDLSSLVAYRTGTAPLDPDLADAFYEKYGIPVLQNYGATEFAGGAAGWTLEDFKAHWKAKRGSVGRLNRNTEARTVDPETGEVLADGNIGLLEIRAPNIGNGNDWVRTTDLAIVDADGFLYIKGRADNAIIRGGFKVLPDDVVKVLQGHPAVLEAAVVGLPDRRLGAVPGAAYILRAGAIAPTQDDMKDWLRERLMPYQVPAVIRVVDELPRTPSMKVSLPALQDMLGAGRG